MRSFAKILHLLLHHVANFLRSRKVINTCLRSIGIIFDCKINEDSSSNDFEHLMSKVYSYTVASSELYTAVNFYVFISLYLNLNKL